MQIKDTDIYKLNYFTYNRAFTGSYGKYALSTYPKKRRGRGSSSVSSSLSAAILLGRNGGRKKANTGISIYGGGKNRDDRMAESEIERI